MIRITQGDLLKQDVDAIINTVNCVGVMGKGIALQFKQKWPENYKAYVKACKLGQVRPGEMFVHHLGKFAGKPHFIINFPTKDHWRSKSEISFIEEGLKDLIRVIHENNIKSIAMPPLGCGNGGLNWHIVKPLIEKYLAPLGNTIEVALFEPKGAPRASSMEIRTPRPAMTAGRAIMVKLLSRYRETGYLLSKLEVQKLGYFAAEAGALSELSYCKNRLGPYSTKLNHALRLMEGHFITGLGDNDTATAEISVVPSAVEEADRFLEHHEAAHASLERIEQLISGFETPYGMELLATVHWVAKHEQRQNTVADVSDGIANWDPSKPAWGKRKTSLMQPEHISIALNRINELNWI